VIRRIALADQDDVLALNTADVVETSPLDRDRLGALASMAAYFSVFTEQSQVAGFLLALREDAGYDNPNFAWFRARYDRFCYIDRVVVDAAHRRRGIASRLYDDLERCSIADGVPLITCEVNVEPPNPASLSFHRSRGFVEAGQQRLVSSRKRVAMLVKSLPD
jgi:predicted GNAT superfamily acetyltransferase